MIEEKTLRTLEYDKVLDRVAARTSFTAGRERILTLRPATKLAAVRQALAETTEARRLLDAEPSVHLGGAHDIRESVRRAEVGAVLTPVELLDIGSTVAAASRLRRTLRSLDAGQSWLRATIGRLIEGDELARDIEATFNDSGEVLDSASPILRRLRHDIQAAEARLTERLNSLITSADQRTLLQEPIVTMRNGRFVVPVRAEARGRVPGIVHDQSASGQTVFVEPLIVTEMNNRLKELQVEEQREIERILRELSERVAARAPALRATVESLAELDSAFARARYAAETDAVEPHLNEQGEITLVEARHPLLTGRVVPTSLRLGHDFRVLVITGPNTGGKTVALKTVGLLTLMAQAGMHVPAGPGTNLAVFPSIFADIGDEQSIEQNLSSFSAHLGNIVAMLPTIEQQSLVLLDELAAGTDPAEGSALARAILEMLLERDARAVVTTHFSELKTFAHDVEGAENASVEFDVRTLSPTYRLVVGLPGRSQALAIGRRLGLPERILEAARRHIPAGAARVEDLLGQIQAERRQIARLFRRTRELHEDATKLRERVRAELIRAGEEREQVLAEAREEGAAAVRELRKRLREIEESAKGTASRRDQRELRERIREAQAAAADVLEEPETVERVATLQPIQTGAVVQVRSLDQQGTVLAVDGDEAEVQVGNFKLRRPLDDLQVLTRSERRPERTVEYVPVSTAPALELDVRGQRADDVLREIDQYLHDNYVHGQGTVRIVHGKGTGALRRAIRDQLKEHPLVKGYGPEKPERGGEGVTVVQLTT